MTEDILQKPLHEVFDGNVNNPGIPEMLELIGRLTPKVNAVTDQVNALIRHVEQHLTKVGAGVYSCIEIGDIGTYSYSFEPHSKTDKMEPEDRKDAEVTKAARLSHERNEGNFRIVLTETVTWYDDESDECFEVILERPLSECPREKKLYAVHFLPELLFKIAQDLREMSDRAERLLADENLVRSFGVIAGTPSLKSRAGKHAQYENEMEIIREGTERLMKQSPSLKTESPADRK